MKAVAETKHNQPAFEKLYARRDEDQERNNGLYRGEKEFNENQRHLGKR